MTDFDAILNTKMDDIEKPRPLPSGTYTFIISDYETGESINKGTPFIRFKCSPVSAGADVDAAELQGISLTNRKLSLTFWMTDDSKHRFKSFLSDRGISTTGQTIKSLLPATKGVTFTGFVVQQINEKTGDVFNNIDRVIAG